MKYTYNILVVDDIAANRFTAKSLLEQLENVTVIEAESGEAALAATIEQNVDLILLDIQMPGMDGFETARHFKMTASTRDIPIIFITAVFKTEEFFSRGYEVGGVDYLTKPIDDNLLLNRIKHYMKLFEREQELLAALNRLKEKERELQGANKELEVQIRERTVELNQANDAIISADVNGRIIFWNKGAKRIFQYTEQEVIGNPLTMCDEPEGM